MKTLPNGDKAIYIEGGIWSLIGGFALLICIVIGYFAIPFSPDTPRWIYIFMVAPFLVMAIMLFKNYFKPSPAFIASSQGIEFRNMNKLDRMIKLSWEQISNIYYQERRGYEKVPIYVLIFKTGEGSTYEFNLTLIDEKDQEILCRIFHEHHLKITAPPIKSKDLQAVKALSQGKSNCVKTEEEIYTFYRSGRYEDLVAAIFMSILVIAGYFFIATSQEGRVGWFFATLPIWVIVLMQVKMFLKPSPALTIYPKGLFFMIPIIGHPAVEIKWENITAVHHEIQDLGSSEGIQHVLVFILQNEQSYPISLKGIVQIDYDKIVSICKEHNLIVRDKLNY